MYFESNSISRRRCVPTQQLYSTVPSPDIDAAHSDDSSLSYLYSTFRNKDKSTAQKSFSSSLTAPKPVRRNENTVPISNISTAKVIDAAVCDTLEPLQSEKEHTVHDMQAGSVPESEGNDCMQDGEPREHLTHGALIMNTNNTDSRFRKRKRDSDDVTEQGDTNLISTTEGEEEIDWIGIKNVQQPSEEVEHLSSTASVEGGEPVARTTEYDIDHFLQGREEMIVKFRKSTHGTERRRQFQKLRSPSKPRSAHSPAKDRTSGPILMTSDALCIRWKEMVRNCTRQHPNLFSEPCAALMGRQATGTEKRPQEVYYGLRVLPENCFDLTVVYENKYKSRALLNVSGGQATFALVRSTMGQFMRWAIVFGKLERFDEWKTNHLFSLFLNANLVKSFVNYFIISGSPATFAAKCNSLLGICQAAKSFVAWEGNQNSEIKQSSIYLRNTFNAAKTKSREQYRLNHRAEDRINNLTIVTESDIKKAVQLSETILDDITAGFVQDVQSSGK